MSIQPNRSEFDALTSQGNAIPVYLDLTADCETPLGAYSKIRHEAPSFLFESIVGGERISRFSFLGSNPRKVYRIFESETTITQKGGATETVPTPADPLKLIESEMASYQPIEMPDMPQFSGGAVGFVGHEFIHSIEPTVAKPSENPLEVPILYYMITDSVLIFDHVRQILRICVPAHTSNDTKRGSRNAYDQAVAEIERIYSLLERQRPLSQRPIGQPNEIYIPRGNFTQEQFEVAVDKVKDYVRSGDVIQTVLSQRFAKDFKPAPIDLYRALRTVNPSPYMFLIEEPDFAVVGASPEVHVRLTGDQV